MALRICRFVSLLCAAAGAGLAFAHVLELPAKSRYDGPLYVRLQTSLYNAWGPTASIAEPAGILATVITTLLVRRRQTAFPLSLFATICLLLGLGVFFLFNNPVNRAFYRAAPSVPADWKQLRARWEFGHTMNFMLHLAAFSALLLAVILDQPPRRSVEELWKGAARALRSATAR